MDYRRVNHSFPPFYDSESRILILGSFPSVKSLEDQFYYANPTNRFFPVLEKIFGEEIGNTIEDRKNFLKKHHIALYDVIEECSIRGSSDQSIKDVKVSDIQKIIDQSKIQVVFTTGGLASKLYKKHVKCDITHIALPSTSGANARMRLEDLEQEYKKILEYL